MFCSRRGSRVPQHFIDVLRDEVKVVNRRRELVAAGRLAKNRGHVGRHPKPNETSGYMGGQTGLAADSGGDLMSAWDPDKLEKRVTEVADEVGKLAEAVAILPVSGQGIGVRAVGEVSVLVEGVGHDCRMPGARCRDRPGLALADGTGVFFFAAAADRKVAPKAPYLW